MILIIISKIRIVNPGSLEVREHPLFQEKNGVTEDNHIPRSDTTLTTAVDVPALRGWG